MEKKKISTLGELVLVRKHSEKSDKDYSVLAIDLGYTLKYLTFNLQDIAEICDIKPSELANLPLGVYKLLSPFE